MFIVNSSIKVSVHSERDVNFHTNVQNVIGIILQYLAEIDNETGTLFTHTLLHRHYQIMYFLSHVGTCT